MNFVNSGGGGGKKNEKKKGNKCKRIKYKIYACDLGVNFINDSIYEIMRVKFD